MPKCIFILLRAKLMINSHFWVFSGTYCLVIPDLLIKIRLSKSFLNTRVYRCCPGSVAAPLLCRKVFNHLPIHRVHPRTGYDADDVIVDIDNRKIIERGLIELVHYVFHWIVDTQDNVDGFHQLAYGELVIEFGAEHNVADLREIDDSEQGVALIDDGNKIGMASTDYLYQLAQKKVGRYGRIVFLDNTIETHQGECSVIGVVGDEFSFSGESHSINAVRLEDVDGEIRTDADNHQRHKQLVSTGELCDEKNARERCMHHAGHYTCHTEQREILFGDVDSDLIDIPNSGKEKAAESADKQRWSKCSAASASAVSG